MASRKSSSDHDKMVKYVADWLVEHNYQDVRADVKGFDSPEKITWSATNKGHIPDNSAKNAQQNRFIFEVETDDSIDDSHTEDQWNLFSAFVNQHGGEFWVVVPESSIGKAEKRVSSLGVTAKVWGV